MNNLRSTLATVWRIAAPYFRSDDKWAGRGLLAAVIVIELASVFLTVLFNRWNNVFYNALQERNQAVFTSQIAYFCVLATFWIALKVYQLYLNQWLQIRWRRWMTARYLGEWMDGANHYRMQLLGDAADNPDQRIAEDTQRFVEQTLSLGIGILSAIVTLASFVVILWGLSNEAPLHLFGKDIPIPGYLVWGALIYAALGTWLTHLIGRPLVGLNFQQQRFEADFRFNLVRARENAEQIALLHGEPAERKRLLSRFGFVVENWLGITAYQEGDRLHRGLFAGRGDLPLRADRAGLLRREGPARRHDADDFRLRQRAGFAVVHHHLVPHHRRLAIGGAAAGRV